MMKLAVLCALVGFAACQQQGGNQGNSRTQGKFVWDLLKAPLNADEVAILLNSKDASYPTYDRDALPQTGFSCASKAQPGFYADVDAQCQVFHRCDQQLNQTDYLCVNSTIFNQITLVCDSWFNVDCGKSLDYENYANSRLYTNQPLFDSPPADYLTPSQLVLAKNQGVSQVAAPAPAKPSRKSPRFSQICVENC